MEFFEGDLDRQPRDRRAEARMDAPAEAKVSARLAGNIITIRIGKLPFVAVA